MTESAAGPAAEPAAGPIPALAPDELVAAGGEREILEAFLDYYRGAVVAKVRGVSEVDARRRIVPSATTLGGIPKHLRWVEMSWFQRRFAGRPDSELPIKPGSAADPDADFRLDSGETVEQVVADYLAECDRSRAAAAGHDLDEPVPHHRLGRVSLRWIYVHMIEETARHAGHADILRELIDDTTGH